MYEHVPYIYAMLIIGHILNDGVFLPTYIYIYIFIYFLFLIQLSKVEYVPVLCPVHSEYNTSGMKVHCTCSISMTCNGFAGEIHVCMTENQVKYYQHYQDIHEELQEIQNVCTCTQNRRIPHSIA